MKKKAVKDPALVNGRRYHLWPQFVENKSQWIGGTLEELPGDGPGAVTTITDIRFGPNGTESAMFSVVGEAFTCETDVKYLAVDPSFCGDGWTGFVCAVARHHYRIRPPAVNQSAGISLAARADLAADIETDRRRELRAFGENPENV